MIAIFGYQFQSLPQFRFLGDIYGAFLTTVVVWVIVSIVTYFIFSYVLRWITRRIPGEIDDIILSIVRIPFIVLIVAFGVVNSLEVFQMSEKTVGILEDIFNTILILIVAYLVLRVVKDVVIKYGESWAKKTESNVDDIIIPIVNLFGRLLVILFASLLILPLWGINVTSVLLGAGVIGLILGLALQETLSNIFSGVNLLMDAPFRTNDLIGLSDGKICKVEKIGLRATQLYYVDEHSTIYVPNKDLANTMIVNITKPTVDLKVSIGVGVGYNSDLEKATEFLEEIAITHPNVLVSNIEDKMKKMEMKINDNLSNKKHHKKMEVMLNKLKKEQELNQQIIYLNSKLLDLIEGVKDREKGGFTTGELNELHDRYVVPIDEKVNIVVKCMKDWSEITDPWAKPDELDEQYVQFKELNELLENKWLALREEISRPKPDKEMQLDDMVQNLRIWINTKYKIITEPWKDPQAIFKGFGASSIDLQLEFYIDDIRMEHYERKQRVNTEIAKEILERFRREGVEIPFPQMDVWLRNQEKH